MRRQLIAVFAALALLIVIAFVVPLAFLLHRTAEDRAVDAARADIAALVPVLAISEDHDLIQAQMNATVSGRSGLMTIVLPGGIQLGRPLDEPSVLTDSIGQRRSTIQAVDDGSGDTEVIRVVGVADERVVGMRVLVPNEELRRGLSAAYTTLGVVGFALIAVGVFAADRLARSVVKSTERLATAADALGGGDLRARVEPEGPAELRQLAITFNALGGQVEGMLERERTLVSEMSHRLRTPLTRLRLRIGQVRSPELANDLTSDLDEATGTLTDLIREVRFSIDERAVGETCDAVAVTAERIAFWKVLATEQNRLFHTRLADPPLLIEMAPLALTELLDILLDNVFSHTAPSTGLEVGVEAAQDQMVTIWVADNGPGWAAGSGSTAGSGIGLTIARQRAVDRGGSLYTSRSRHGGARVDVTIPRANHRLGGPAERQNRARRPGRPTQAS